MRNFFLVKYLKISYYVSFFKSGSFVINMSKTYFDKIKFKVKLVNFFKMYNSDLESLRTCNL